MCEFHLLIFPIAFLLFFQAYVLDALQTCVLDVFPNSCYSSKLAFLMFLKFTFLLLFLDTFLLLLSIMFLLLQACNKSFLLLQVHILTTLFGHALIVPSSCSCCSKLLASWTRSCCSELLAKVLVAPSFHSCYSFSLCSYYSKSRSYYSFQSCSCCSKLVFKCCSSWLCSCYSKLVFEFCSSQLHSSAPSSRYWYSKFKILQKPFYVAFGFLIFCFMFWPLLSSPLAIGLSRWFFLLCLLDVVVFQGYPCFSPF